MVRDPNNVTRTTIKETLIDNYHNGHLTGPVKLATYDPNSYIIEHTNREIDGDTNYLGTIENNKGLGYITNEKNAPTTNRQLLTKEYGGTAMSFYKKNVSYDKDYNANINLSKEQTLKGRKPTLESVKLAIGEDMIHVKSKKMPTEINNREPSKEKTYVQSYRDASKYSKDKNNYDFTILDEQINPALLMPFKNNPYTHSLNSS